MITAVISDLDGTLVDTAAANTAAYADAFGAIGLGFDADEYRASFGLRFDGMMARLAPSATLEQIEGVRTEKSERYPRHFGLLRPNDGLIALLATMRASGIHVGLASTAARRNVTAVLAGLGLQDLFEVVVAGEDVERGKPAPDCYLRAAALLEQEPSGCLAIEDSPVGIAAARSAGYQVLEVAL